jgi:hypothetical protein
MEPEFYCFKKDNNGIFCRICSKLYSFKKKSHIIDHLNSKSHFDKSREMGQVNYRETSQYGDAIIEEY